MYPPVLSLDFSQLQEFEDEIRGKADEEVKQAMQRARNEQKPHIDELFNDVYDELPQSLQRQKKKMWEIVNKYKEHYPLDIHKT